MPPKAKSNNTTAKLEPSTQGLIRLYISFRCEFHFLYFKPRRIGVIKIVGYNFVRAKYDAEKNLPSGQNISNI